MYVRRFFLILVHRFSISSHFLPIFWQFSNTWPFFGLLFCILLASHYTSTLQLTLIILFHPSFLSLFIHTGLRWILLYNSGRSLLLLWGIHEIDLRLSKLPLIFVSFLFLRLFSLRHYGGLLQSADNSFPIAKFLLKLVYPGFFLSDRPQVSLNLLFKLLDFVPQSIAYLI